MLDAREGKIMSNIKTKIAVKAVIMATSIFSMSTLLSQTLEEIVVTAQIREQSLQDVPISVSALSGESIEDRSVDNLSSLATSVPNFYVAETQIDTSISIRGVV